MTTATQELTRTDVLDRALARCGNSQTKLAEALRQAGGTISRWKNGKATPEEGRCLRLAKMTGYPPAEVLRAFGYDPEPLGITQGPAAPLPPADYDLRLALRIADGLAKFATDVKAMISASQPDYDQEGFPSRMQHTDHYVWQERRPPVPMGLGLITFLGDRRPPVMAS